MLKKTKAFFGLTSGQEVEPWDLDLIVFQSEGIDTKGNKYKFPIRIRDLLDGTVIFGQSGGGKTSASVATVVREALKKGFGAVCTTVKPGDAMFYKNLAIEAGREKDVIIFNKESGMCFDPLQYELNRSGRGAGNVTNLIDLLVRLNGLLVQDSKPGEDATFWTNTLYRLLGNIIKLLIMAGDEPVSFHNMRRIMEAAVSDDIFETMNIFKAFQLYSQTLAEGQASEEEQSILINHLVTLSNKNFIIECLVKAKMNQVDPNSLSITQSYFCTELRQMADKTRASVIEMVLGLIEPFNFGLLKDCFTSRVDECLKPESTWEEGKIIILDFPIKEYGLAGRLAIGFYRFLFMMAAERRITDESGLHRPVLLVQDEAQAFLDPNYDTQFQSTSRSSRVATITITQNIHNFIIAMGSIMPEAKMKSLLSNLALKIFHAQNCFETNEYASKVIANDKKDKLSKTMTMDSLTTNISEEYLPQIQPIEFTRLKTGGIRNNFEVEAIVTKAGKSHDWFGANVFKATFHQNNSKS